MKWNLVKRAASLMVGTAIVAHLALLALQFLGMAPLWLAELSRFLPFYWLLLPLCVALALSLFLRPVWRLAALANLLLFCLLTMDFHWRMWEDSDLAGSHVRVLSYNIKALSARHKEGGIEEIEREVEQYAPDIVALQDAQQWLTFNGSDTVASSARPVFGLPYVVAFDQYVLASRYPLEACQAGKLGEGGKPGNYLHCSVRIDSKRVQLVTAHFVSPRHSLLVTKREWFDGLHDWQTNLDTRLGQARTLLTGLEPAGAPLIVMGDFNAPERSPVIAELKRAGLRDAFHEAGTGWGYTHGHALSQHIDLFRIDHILLGSGITVQSAEVGSSEASEHNPVIADLLIRP